MQLSISKQVSKYNYIYSAPKSQLGWLNLPHSPTVPLPVTAKHWVVRF